MNNPPPELGLGILLAASLSIPALMRIFSCDERAANSFKEQAVADMMALNSAIARARMVRQ